MFLVLLAMRFASQFQYAQQGNVMHYLCDLVTILGSSLAGTQSNVKGDFAVCGAFQFAYNRHTEFLVEKGNFASAVFLSSNNLFCY